MPFPSTPAGDRDLADALTLRTAIGNLALAALSGTPGDGRDIDLLKSTNIEPPVLAELFQKLEANGVALGRPNSSL